MTKSSLIQSVLEYIRDQGNQSFDRLALDLFALQYESMEGLRAYWDSLGARPETVTHPDEIPPVSLSLFKRERLFFGDTPVRTFRTSGTSGKGRGASLFDARDLELMDESILENVSRNLFADREKTRFFLLVPSPEEAPEVIMAYGMARIASQYCLGEPYYAVRGGKLLLEEGVSTLRKWQDRGEGITLIGGSFGLMNFVDAMGDDRFQLPQGSRLMDAGGFKGRSRELDRAGFVQAMLQAFGLERERCFNLYGLTELASQFYGSGGGAKVCAPWTRVRVVDPLTLRDVAVGERGVPLLYDLANVGRPFAILTDDIAEQHENGRFDILGRASGSVPRGCSLSLEEVA